MRMTDSSELQRLVDERRFDEVLRRVSLVEIAEAWMRYCRKAVDVPGVDDPDWWAVEMWMEDGRWADEQRLRDGVLALVAAAETDSDFGALGAAIMEYIVNDDEDRLRWIEAQARVSEPFRRSLANIYVWGSQPDAIAARIEAAAQVALPRPKCKSKTVAIAAYMIELVRRKVRPRHAP
jgi:hypothetical protein